MDDVNQYEQLIKQLKEIERKAWWAPIKMMAVFVFLLVCWALLLSEVS